jgi:hypothetical protein
VLFVSIGPTTESAPFTIQSGGLEHGFCPQTTPEVNNNVAASTLRASEINPFFIKRKIEMNKIVGGNALQKYYAKNTFVKEIEFPVFADLKPQFD